MKRRQKRCFFIWSVVHILTMALIVAALFMLIKSRADNAPTQTLYMTGGSGSAIMNSTLDSSGKRQKDVLVAPTDISPEDQSFSVTEIEYLYDESGRVSSVKLTFGEDTKEIPLTYNASTDSSSGSLVKIEYDSNKKIKAVRIGIVYQFEFDGKGRMTTALIGGVVKNEYKYNGEKAFEPEIIKITLLDGKETYEAKQSNDSLGFIFKVEVSEPGGNEQSIEKYSFDIDGRLTKYSVHLSTESYQMTDVFKYTENGKLSVYTHAETNKDGSLESILEQKYDSNERVVEKSLKTTVEADGKSYVAESIVEKTKYTESGKTVTTTMNNYKKVDKGYKYDGKFVLTNKFDKDGNLIDQSWIEYDAKNNVKDKYPSGK